MSTPNSWCPVKVINKTGFDVTNVTLKHRYDHDHFDERTWPKLSDGASGDGLKVGFWTGFGRTGYDYWQIFFTINGASYTCKDNFYCFLTSDDVGGLVRIEFTTSTMHVICPKSSSCNVSVSVQGFPTANKSLGYYNIGHMANTPAAVLWAVRKGANGIEADLNFDNHGVPTVYKHGGAVSDCSCNPFPSDDHVCSVVSRNDATPASDLLRCIASQSGIALHVVDTKMNDDVDQGAAGKAVIGLLERELFGAGYRGNVIVGTGDTKYLDYLKAAAVEATKSQYAPRIAFTFDGAGDDYASVFKALDKINSKHIVYGTGTSVCSAATYYPAITHGCSEEQKKAQGLTYIWTLDSKNSMQKYLESGARGIMTNMPSVLGDLLKQSGLHLASPSTLIPSS